MKNFNNTLINNYLQKDLEENGSGAVERLAAKSNVCPATIRALKKDSPNKPAIRIDTALSLAEAIGTDLNSLFGKGTLNC